MHCELQTWMSLLSANFKAAGNWHCLSFFAWMSSFGNVFMCMPLLECFHLDVFAWMFLFNVFAECKCQSPRQLLLTECLWLNNFVCKSSFQFIHYIIFLWMSLLECLDLKVNAECKCQSRHWLSSSQYLTYGLVRLPAFKILSNGRVLYNLQAFESTLLFHRRKINFSSLMW